MATYADLFGKKSGSFARFVTAGEVGETLLMVQTDEPKQVPQQIEVDGKKYNKWLVQEVEGGKYKVVPEVPDFDESKYHNAFQPSPVIHLPVKVVGKLLKNGEKAPDFEPYDATWDLGGGDQTPKLQDAMLEADIPAAPGTRYKRKLLSTNPKPYKYSNNMKAGG